MIPSARTGRFPIGTGAIAVVVAVGFLLRLAFGLGYWVGKPLMLDEQEYLLLATRVAAGQGFTYPPPPASGPAPRHFERPPLFVFALAAVLKGTGDPLVASSGPDSTPLPRSSSEVPLSVKFFQAFAGAVGIALVAALARRAAGGRAAVVAAAMTAVYPPLVWTCAYVLAEPLYSALALTTVWALLRAGEATGGRQARLAFGAGLLAGAALLTKEAMLFFLPLAAGWMIVRHQRLVVAGLVAGVTVLTVPWIARNYAVHQRFVLTAAHGGVTLWTGNNELARGEGDLAANPEMGRARVAFEDRHPGISNQDLDRLYYREAWRFVVEHPAAWIALDARKLFYTFVPMGPSYRLHSRRFYAASLVSYGILMPLALIGLVQLARVRRLSSLWALWLLAASTLIVSIVFFPQERFRIPVIDPTALVCAAVCARERPWT